MSETRRPPLLTFLTYNRLGNTAISLPSLLRTDSDFELHIMDNNSKDDTWDFLQATKDPRIKSRTQFNQNMGVAHPLNYALVNRKEDQDFINFEYDFRIHNKDFVQDFWDVLSEFPEMGAISATTFPNQLQLIDSEIIKTPEKFINRNGKRIYLDTIMGFCSFFPYETMNILKYYDEINCLLDMEIQVRIEGLKKQTCYAMDIRTSHTTMGGNCDTCLAYHNPCEQGERKCLTHYKRIISDITTTLGFDIYRQNIADRKEGKMSYTCDSLFSGNMTEEEKKGSKHILELFKNFSEGDSK